MTPAQVIRHFGRGLPKHKHVSATANALGLTTAAVRLWKAQGRVPINTQARIERMTKGELRLKV